MVLIVTSLSRERNRSRLLGQCGQTFVGCRGNGLKGMCVTKFSSSGNKAKIFSNSVSI